MYLLVFISIITYTIRIHKYKRTTALYESALYKSLSLPKTYTKINDYIYVLNRYIFGFIISFYLLFSVLLRVNSADLSKIFSYAWFKNNTFLTKFKLYFNIVKEYYKF